MSFVIFTVVLPPSSSRYVLRLDLLHHDCTEFKKFSFNSLINVNTINISTLGGRNAKTYLKIEGVTGKRTDVIFMSDMRVGGN